LTADIECPVRQICSEPLRKTNMRDGKIIVARLWPFFSGGSQSRAPVILGINPEKYETIIIYLTKKSSNPNIFEQKGKKVFYLTENSKLRFFNPFVISKLTAVLKNQGVDILHCHMHKATVYGTIAAKFAGTPTIIAHVHGLGRTRNFRRKLVNRFILSKTAKILTVGEAVRKDVLQNNPFLSPDKVINIGNQIDYDYFAKGIDKQAARDRFAIPRDSPVFGAAGRLAKNKGQTHLIRAFSGIRKQIPNARLLIAGDGELKETLKMESAALGCDKYVHFAGRISDMPVFYSAIDLFVQPSIGSEGLPRVILEAMAAGVVVIGTDVGGIPEILNDGQFGCLVPGGDENRLADAMIKLAQEDRNQLQILIEKAQKRIKDNFTPAVVIRRLEKIYEDCMIKNA